MHSRCHRQLKLDLSLRDLRRHPPPQTLPRGKLVRARVRPGGSVLWQIGELRHVLSLLPCLGVSTLKIQPPSWNLTAKAFDNEMPAERVFADYAKAKKLDCLEHSSFRSQLEPEDESLRPQAALPAKATSRPAGARARPVKHRRGLSQLPIVWASQRKKSSQRRGT